MSESFESVMTYAQAVMSDCDTPILDRLKRAHDREIEHARKAEYNRGYEDALRRKETDTWQLDMERAEVARHIDAVTLDGGSHANLSALAAAVYEPSGGWTSGACAMLRERLVRLLGGVSEHPYPTSTYDVLGNERQKAVCELRKIHADAGGFVKALAKALDVEWQAPRVHQTLANVRDRLIHLLGGDGPNFTEIAKTINLDEKHDGELMESGENHKMATITDEPTLSDLWGVWKDGNGTCPNENGTCPNDGSTSSITDELWAELDELRGHSRTCPESDGDVSMSAPSMSITDDLRKYVAETWDGSMYVNRIPMELRAIADRIDEQFDRICEQWERTATDTAQEVHDSMEAECNKLVDERYMWRGKAMQLADVVDRYVGRCDDLLDLLRDAAKEYVDSNNVWSYASEVSENMRLERKCNELLELLRDAAREYEDKHHWAQVWHDRSEDMRMERDCAYAERDEARAKVLKLESENAEWRRGAEYVADKLQSLTASSTGVIAERDELQKRLDEMREQREHWASEATKMYRLFFSHDEYCVPNDPSEMVAASVRQLQEKCSALQAKLDECERDDLTLMHRTLKRMLGEAKNAHDTLVTRVQSAPRIARERDKYKSLAKANERWCDALLELLKDARDEYKMLDRMSAETSANFHAMRDRALGLEAEHEHWKQEASELRAKLGIIREAVDA